jgi:hypothetical protein
MADSDDEYDDQAGSDDVSTNSIFTPYFFRIISSLMTPRLPKSKSKLAEESARSSRKREEDTRRTLTKISS